MDEQLGALLDRLDALEKDRRDSNIPGGTDQRYNRATTALGNALIDAWPTLSRALREREWIPVTMKPPEVFGEYIVATDAGDVTRYFFTPEALHHPIGSAWRGPEWSNGFGVAHPVTHWMPLPAAPKAPA